MLSKLFNFNLFQSWFSKIFKINNLNLDSEEVLTKAPAILRLPSSPVEDEERVVVLTLDLNPDRKLNKGFFYRYKDTDVVFLAVPSGEQKDLIRILNQKLKYARKGTWLDSWEYQIHKWDEN